jgi:hypothetical protein
MPVKIFIYLSKPFENSVSGINFVYKLLIIVLWKLADIYILS